MKGEEGDDIYIYNTGDGKDKIYNYDWYDEYTDLIKLTDQSLTIENIAFVKDGNDLIIRFKDNQGTLDENNQITINNQFLSYSKLEKIELSDGSLIDLTDNLTLLGTDRRDYFYGSDKIDNFSGQGGNDSINGGKGDDILKGGQGNDSLSGGSGNDVLEGGEEDDYIDADIGNDTFIYNTGDGKDTFVNHDWNHQDEDLIKLTDQSITKENLIFIVDGSNLVIKFQNNNSLIDQDNQITINRQFIEYRQIEWLELANGERIDLTHGLALFGTNQRDYFYGTNMDNIYSGLDGDDRISSGEGDDILNGNKGNDTISAGDGDDILEGGKGDDQINADEGNDIFMGLDNFN